MADFDRLVGRLATFNRLAAPQRAAFIRDAVVRDVPESTRVITHGDEATAAYIILAGETAAGIPEPDGGYRGLSTMRAGDFFGEIGTLTGSPGRQTWWRRCRPRRWRCPRMPFAA